MGVGAETQSKQNVAMTRTKPVFYFWCGAQLLTPNAELISDESPQVANSQQQVQKNHLPDGDHWKNKKLNQNMHLTLTHTTKTDASVN